MQDKGTQPESIYLFSAQKQIFFIVIKTNEEIKSLRFFVK